MVVWISLRFPDVDLAFVVEFAVVPDCTQNVEHAWRVSPANSCYANGQVHRDGGKAILEQIQPALQDLDVAIEGHFCLVVHTNLT